MNDNNNTAYVSTVSCLKYSARKNPCHIAMQNVARKCLEKRLAVQLILKGVYIHLLHFRDVCPVKPLQCDTRNEKIPNFNAKDQSM